MKKRFLLILAALILALALPVSVFGDNNKGVTFTASADRTSVTLSGKTEQITMTVSADKNVGVDGMMMDFHYPHGWSIVSITGSELSFTDGDYVLRYKDEDFGRLCWQEASSRTVSVRTLAVVTFAIPADTPAGTYTLSATDFELTSGGGDIWESGASVSVEINVTGGSGSSSQQPSDSPGNGAGENDQPGNSAGEGSGTGIGGGDAADKDDITVDPDTQEPVEESIEPEKNSGEKKGSFNFGDPLAWAAAAGALVLIVLLIVLRKKKK